MRSLEEMIAQYAATPARITEPVILINIGLEWYPGLPNNPKQLYERTRRWWDANPTKRKIKPKYAVTTAHGIIRQVYRIKKWTRHDLATAKHDTTRRLPKRIPKKTIRWGFSGFVATEMKHYIGQSVSRKPGAANPIAYVNC